jgi:hypothetical protein
MIHLATLLVVLFLMAARVQAMGGQIIDQQNSPPPSPNAGTFGSSIEFFSPIGQSFTPRLAGLDFVTLTMMDASRQSPGTFVVEIHQGLDGALLAASPAVTLPIGFGDGTRFGTNVDFEFDRRVSLSPGDLYSLIVRDTNPGTGANFFLSGTNGFDSYPAGVEIENGLPSTGLNYDLFFQEGVSAVPGPSSFMLLVLAATTAAVLRLSSFMQDRARGNRTARAIGARTTGQELRGLKNRVPVWLKSPLFIMSMLATVFVMALLMPTVPGSLPPVVHPKSCHACSASTPASAAARDDYLVRVGAFERVDPPTENRGK